MKTGLINQNIIDALVMYALGGWKCRCVLGLGWGWVDYGHQGNVDVKECVRCELKASGVERGG